MQTFLPYRDFMKSAKSLDRQRLGKQRVEAYQILKACFDEESGWRSHPAVQMWIGHEATLLSYIFTICDAWRKRGIENRGSEYRDSIEEKAKKFWDEQVIAKKKTFGESPPSWLGDSRFHEAHRSNLLRKDADHYSQFGWDVGPGLEYFWPSKEG